MRPALFEESGRIKSYYAQFMTKQKPNPFLKKRGSVFLLVPVTGIEPV